MITLRLELLVGAYHAADHTLRSPEWPPHPDRVYQALTATLHALGNRPQHRAVLEAIEQVHWYITASEAVDRLSMVHYVPRNEDQGRGKGSYNPAFATARMKERHLPVVQPNDPAVFFHMEAAVNVAALDELARGVTRLGRSLVALAVVPTTFPPDWEPAASGTPGAELLVRVPYVGRLADLETAHEAQRRAGLRWASYRRCAVAPAELQGTYGEFNSLVVLAASGRGVDGTRAAPLVEAARRALLATCPDPLPAWLSGHAPDGTPLRGSHVAIVPTVFTGPHGDGRVMGLGLAIPKHVEAIEVRRAMHTVLLDGLRLADQHWATANTRGLTTEVASWTRPAAHWTTATPMEVRRRDRRSALEIVTEWAERAGLPVPINARLRGEPFIGGALHASRFAPGKRPRYRLHALVEWEEPVRGPVALGMGRYRGFGLMRPL